MTGRCRTPRPELEARLHETSQERDHFRKLYLEALERCVLLERGIMAGNKAERFTADGSQLTLGVLGLLLTPEAPEHRPASLVLVRIVRPKFVRKRVARDVTPVLIAEPPERPIERGLAGPGLLAKTIVYRWQDHLPLYRQERIHARDGLGLARSTICGWHEQLADLAERLVEAMLRDAFTQPYLCVDATGVLVQADEQCRRAHFWVLVAPGRHVLASCQLHGIEPWAYLCDLLCLPPSWPASRVLELAPAFWQTLQQEDTQQRLAANVFRGVSILDHAHPT